MSSSTFARPSRRALGGFLGLSVIGTAALAACGGGAAADTSVLTVGFPDDSENYDPHQPPQTVSRTVARQITDGLVDQDPETGEIVPWLAESWEVSEDGSRFTFHLREGVTFSDGTPFTSASVKNNFDRIIRIGPLAYIGASHLRGYQSTETPDERTAVVVFDGPNAQFLQAATTQTLGFLADATLALSPEEVARGQVIGTGPYVLDDYSPGDSITLTRRAGYAWPSSNYSNTGEATYETVEISFIPDPTTLAGAVSSGQVDYAFLLDTATLPGVKGSGATVVTKSVKGIASPLVPFIYRPIFQDEAVRRAINNATDRQEIVDRIYQGAGAPATGLLTAVTPGSADLSQYLAYDPDAAIATLEQGGWTTVGDDGIRAKGDQRLTIQIQYSGSGTTSEQLFQLIKTQWAKVGIEFDLKPVTEAQLSETTLYDAPYDLSTWSQGRADPDVLRVVYSSFYENQSFFFGNAIPEVDEALLALQSTTDPEERAQASANAQRIILEGGYSFPLTDAVSNSAAGKKLDGVHLDAENKPVFTDFAPKA